MSANVHAASILHEHGRWNGSGVRGAAAFTRLHGQGSRIVAQGSAARLPCPRTQAEAPAAVRRPCCPATPPHHARVCVPHFHSVVRGAAHEQAAVHGVPGGARRRKLVGARRAARHDGQRGREARIPRPSSRPRLHAGTISECVAGATSRPRGARAAATACNAAARTCCISKAHLRVIDGKAAIHRRRQQVAKLLLFQVQPRHTCAEQGPAGARAMSSSCARGRFAACRQGRARAAATQLPPAPSAHRPRPTLQQQAAAA